MFFSVPVDTLAFTQDGGFAIRREAFVERWAYAVCLRWAKRNLV